MIIKIIIIIIGTGPYHNFLIMQLLLEHEMLQFIYNYKTILDAYLID